MEEAAAAQRVRARRRCTATAWRDPLAVRAPAGRRRLGRHRRPDRGRVEGATRTRRSSRSATASSPSARASTSTNQAEREPAEVAEEFIGQYYAGLAGDAAAVIVVGPYLRERAELLAAALSERRGARSRCASRSAATSGDCASWPSATLASPSTRTGCAASTGASAASSRSPSCARRWGWRSCRCGSRASTSPTWAASTRSPRWSSSRAAHRRSRTTGDSGCAASAAATGPDDFASMEEVLSRRMSRYLEQADLSPHDAETRRELRRPAVAGGDRRRQGPARRGDAGAASLSPSAASP